MLGVPADGISAATNRERRFRYFAVLRAALGQATARLSLQPTCPAGILYSELFAFVFASRERIVGLAARHRIPVIYTNSEGVTAGGLTSYLASLSDAFRQVDIYPAGF